MAVALAVFLLVVLAVVLVDGIGRGRGRDAACCGGYSCVRGLKDPGHN